MTTPTGIQGYYGIDKEMGGCYVCNKDEVLYPFGGKLICIVCKKSGEELIKRLHRDPTSAGLLINCEKHDLGPHTKLAKLALKIFYSDTKN